MVVCWRRLHYVAILYGVAMVTGAECAEPAWKATKMIEAPEAHQAAAADDRFVFAINSIAIAKYDRRTGERLATSTGQAKHLNSGFVLDGKLYCAHSNYPQMPEQSEIKVLDLETMRLTTFKEFGDFGGSLTWVIQYEGQWWCNFARYGNQNAKTFLVKFGDRWSEQARWTYPTEVIQQLGLMSISGGVWREGSLLVTDHDHPLLYELRLPESGSVLKLIGQQPIPFTGQGIAVDAKSGGLVGINRAKRQLIFATRESK